MPREFFRCCSVRALELTKAFVFSACASTDAGEAMERKPVLLLEISNPVSAAVASRTPWMQTRSAVGRSAQ